MRGRTNKEEKYHSYISELEAKEKRNTFRQLLVLLIVAAVSVSGFLVFIINSDDSNIPVLTESHLKPDPKQGAARTVTPTQSRETEIPILQAQNSETEDRPEDLFVAGAEDIAPNAVKQSFNTINKNSSSQDNKELVENSMRADPLETTFEPQGDNSITEKETTQDRLKTPTTNSEKSLLPNNSSNQHNEGIAFSREQAPEIEKKTTLGSVSISKNETKISSSNVSISNKKPLQIVQKMPQFKGGPKAMYKWLNQRLRYPQAAKDHNIEGKVYLQFVVQPSGELSNMKVVRGLGYGCDKEALRIARKMPKWIPGEQYGQLVPVLYTIHVQFRIQ